MKKAHLKIILSLLLLSAMPQWLAAQRIMTVDEAIAAALKNNYDILLLKSDSTSFAIDYAYRNAGFLPRVNGSAGYLSTVNNQSQKLGDGTSRKSNGVRSSNINGSVGLNWTVFDGLKMFATRDKLAEFVRLGEYNIKVQVVNTVAAVVTRYFNIVAEKQQLKAIEEQMSINEERVKLAEKKFSVGLGAKPELLQAKVDLNAQKAAHLSQQTNIEQLKEDLNELMAAPPNTAYDVTDSIPINNNLVMMDIMTYAEKNNPVIKAAEQNITIANLTLKERKAELWPTVSLNSAYNFSRANNNTVINTFTPLYNQNLGFNYGISASIPILNGFNTRRLIKQAKLDIDRNKIVYENLKYQNDISISKSFKSYELKKKTLQLEEENILLAKENVFIAVERLRLGVSTYLELRETQKSLEDAYTRLIQARYDTKVAETELLRLKGELVR